MVTTVFGWFNNYSFLMSVLSLMIPDSSYLSVVRLSLLISLEFNFLDIGEMDIGPDISMWVPSLGRFSTFLQTGKDNCPSAGMDFHQIL
jgi:hypothetical protein